ncbi:hypothetical protein E2C01_001941 [Portunus trituberculatus]|uniref:Uncharacterized protein n=1 Tax=Portunus trituberculatus TaxID=210409 RepID=A0A5B7CNZ8_PORTR|nr:hypothetical protein [Portunus trituberculatus]
MNMKTRPVLRRIFTLSFGCDWVLLILGRVYGGQKINSHSLHYYNPHTSF